ncbi:MAG: response regulator [Clostridiales bacterium]|jgi:putative two-component system response regulator|nr:response regulator [Clostridiales bacterium]
MNKNGIIMIVDDADTNRMLLEAILGESYYIIQAVDGKDALELIYEKKVIPDLMLLDIIMPHISGFELMSILRSEPETENIPVIFISAADNDKSELQGLNAGAVDYISKPFVPDVVKLRVNNFMELLNYRKKLEAAVDKKVAELTAAKDRMIETMATIIEYRNLESGQHVKRMSRLTEILVNRMLEYPKYRKKLTGMNHEVILKAASLHDIGKIAIPDSILQKSGKLTPEEFEIIKTHTTIGGQIIESIMDFNRDVYYKHSRDMALHHHERWDGKGYPQGLSGEDIPLSARILAIVDVYDALRSQRVYKQAEPHDESMNVIQAGAGTQFDPGLVEVLWEVQQEFDECINDPNGVK